MPPKTPQAPTAPQSAGDEISSVAFVSLGCPKNLVDSEKMLGLLAEDGLTPVPADAMDEGGADAVVINTCGFLEASKEESLGEIAHAVELKKQGLVKRVVVAGCLVQRHKAKMLEWCPEVDAFIGVFDRDRVAEAVRPRADRAKLKGLPLPVFQAVSTSAASAGTERGMSAAEVREKGYFESDAARLRLTPRHYAYLRVSEGCNQGCAFCTIPSIRGKMRSKPPEQVVAELRELLQDGAFEILLIGQDTTSYGTDIGYAPGLAGLLRELDKAAAEFGGAWLRLMYAYPSTFSDEMIEALAKAKHILPYIDMPLQHMNDRVLDEMRRKTSRQLIETLLGKLRRIPGMAIRTTFISGFPGETRAEHEELLAFVKQFQFDNLGVFPYSPEDGTKAGAMHAKGLAIAPEEVEARVAEIMLAQQEVVFARNQRMKDTGAEIEVLIDAATGSKGKATAGVGKGGSLYVGRSRAQAPDIDAVTFVQSKDKRAPGEVVRCRVVDFNGYDLVAQPVEELEKKVGLPILRKPHQH